MIRVTSREVQLESALITLRHEALQYEGGLRAAVLAITDQLDLPEFDDLFPAEWDAN